MLKVKLLGALCVSMGLFACSSAEMPSRARTDAFPIIAGAPVANADEAVSNDLNIVGFTVDVPKTLLVSEADVFLPNADIVWHGDPAGDRHAQVDAIFSAAFERGTAQMNEGHPVVVSITVDMFHALTPKTRATIGGNYAMHFHMTVLDAETGQIIDGPRLVVADTLASGGRRALREEAEGLTQKVVITARLAEVFNEELRKVRLVQPDLTSRDAFSPSDLTLAQ